MTLGRGSQISTGEKSKLQVSVGQKGGLVRAGSKTEAFLSENEKTLSLKQGIALMSSGKAGLGRESMTVETPETRNVVKGTMLISYIPQSHIKITCIEGNVRVRLKSAFAEFILLNAGQMVIINPADKKLPEPIEIDLAQLTSTSALIGGDLPELPSFTNVENAAALQSQAVEEGQLAETNLILDGLSVENDRGIQVLRELETAPEVQIPVTPPPPPGPSPTPAQPGPVEPDPRDETFIINQTTQFDLVRSTITTPGLDTVQGESFEGTVSYGFPAGTGFETLVPEGLQIVGSVNIPADVENLSLSYVVFGGMQIGDGGTPTLVNIQAERFDTVPDRLRIRQATVEVDGEFSATIDGLSDSGPAGDIPPHLIVSDSSIRAEDIIFTTTDASPSLDSGAEPGLIDIEKSMLEATAGNVYLNATDPASSIVIRNSSQIKALGDFSTILIELNHGGQITVENSSLQAASGILIDGSGDNLAPGIVNLTNVTASADIIRARGFSTGGDALIISGGTYDAGSMLRFYAEGGGNLRFTGDVNVNSNDIVFAGMNVNVDPGSSVRMSTSGRVFAGDGTEGNGHNYNRGNLGRISPSPTQAPYSSRPGF